MIPEIQEPVNALATIEFNDQQKEAIAAAVAWFKLLMDGKTRKRIFFLAGFAGTGKTTVAKEIVRRCVGEYGAVYIAPTGKAASRLKQKGCRGARTLHQFIYNVRGEDEDGDPIFIKKDSLDEKPKLVTLDEASMVGQYDAERLINFGIPILALGDTGQIPPVKASAYFTEDMVDYQLTDIMRQGKESNIIRASFYIRQGKRLPVRDYDDVKVSDEKPSLIFLKKFLGEESQILCSYNSTREKYNSLLRQLDSRVSKLPEIGEKVVCTFNQHGPGFMNGEQGIVKDYEPVPMGELEEDEMPGLLYIHLKSLTDGKDIKCKFNPKCFEGDELERAEALKKPGGFDFGYVLTIHKSQGSEWDNVVVLEEFLKNIPYAKMMYTAVTRAAKKLWVFRA